MRALCRITGRTEHPLYKQEGREDGCRFFQVGFVVDELAVAVRWMQLGYDVIAKSHSSKFRVAYIDTVADFGFYTEVVERTPEFLLQLESIFRACAAWDSSDPVRLLTAMATGCRSAD